MAKGDKEDITVEALLSLTSPEGTEEVRSFDKAWQRALVLPRPVRVTFVKFVRKES